MSAAAARSAHEDTTQEIVSSLRVDRSSPVPLWFQLAQGMEELIGSGRLAPGSQLDNEVLLSERLSLSRPTMRRAMQYLVDHGMVVRRRGIGTRVVQSKVRRPLGMTSLFDDLARTGQQPSTRVLTHELAPATAEVAEALEVAEGSDVVCLVRLRLAGERPIAKMTNYRPPELVELSSDDIERGGLYELLRAQGIMLHSATQTIGARNATPAEARLLEESRGAALLTMQRTAYDDHSRPVEHGSHIYAASRYSF